MRDSLEGIDTREGKRWVEDFIVLKGRNRIRKVEA